MDGTFLRSDRTPHPKNLEMIPALGDSGATFCFATGRLVTSVRTYMDEHKIVCPIVSGNGSLVVDHDGSTIHESRLDSAIIGAILDYAEASGIHVNLYCGESVWFSQSGRFADLYVGRTGCEPTIVPHCDLKAQPANKVLFIDHPANIVAHAGALGHLAGSHGISVVCSEPDYLEFLPAQINKGAGVRALAEKMGLQRHEVAAIGDWHNDYEMLEFAGFAACVANAAPEIRELAHKVYQSNDEGGVAEFIADIIELNKGGRIRA